MNIHHVLGDTYLFDTGLSTLPFYKLNKREIIMFDSGYLKGDQVKLNALLDKEKLIVKGIICSHCHIDHVGNNTFLKQKDNAIIVMPELEAMLCRSLLSLKVYYYNASSKDIEEHFYSMLCETDMIIEEDMESVVLFGKKFGIVHTPGHSLNHVCIITPDDVMYVGDSLIGYDVMNGLKLPYAFLLEEDLKSKKKLLSYKNRKYILAHKGVFDHITKLVEDNISFYLERAFAIGGLIQGHMTMDEIIREAFIQFQIHGNSIYKYAHVERMIRSYMDFLIGRKKVYSVVENGIVKYIKK